MSIRLVTTDQMRFDVDIETYNRITRDVAHVVMERCNQLIEDTVNSNISSALAENVAEHINYDTLTYAVGNNLNYSRIVDIAKTELVNHLLSDERFKTLIQRGINNATIGFIDETVERVTTRIEENKGIVGDT
jgi:hypothetical protein